MKAISCLILPAAESRASNLGMFSFWHAEILAMAEPIVPRIQIVIAPHAIRGRLFLTEEERVGSSLFVEEVTAAGLWLVFDLFLKTILTLFCPTGLICEAAPLTDLVLEVCLTWLSSAGFAREAVFLVCLGLEINLTKFFPSELNCEVAFLTGLALGGGVFDQPVPGRFLIRT